MNSVDLSVVIPVYGELDKLRRCLKAVERALAGAPELKHEVVVSDDCSPGDLVPKLRSEFPWLRLLENTRNLGFSGNTNRGASAARGRILCLLNSDMYVAEDFFVDCLAPFVDPKLFAVCGRILEPGAWNDGFKTLRLTPRRARVNSVSATDPRSDLPAAIPYANGGGSFFRRSMFEELRGFDPIFSPYYWEDADLGYRAWKRGYTISYLPRLCLEHDHQASIGKQAPSRVRRIKFRNHLLFVWRNFTDRSLCTILACATLPMALSLLARLRFRRWFWLLATLRYLPSVLRSRRERRRFQLRTDAELAKILSAAGHLHENRP